MSSKTAKRLSLALVSYGIYALILNPVIALGFMLLFVIHEYGHLYQVQQQKLQNDGIAFYPLLGALIILREKPKTVLDEARIGLGGPLLGTIAVLLVAIAAGITGHQWLLVLVFLGAGLNAVNLLPVSPLDGGRIIAAIQPKIWVVGWVGLLIVFLWRPSLITALLLPLAGVESFQRLSETKTEAEYYKVAVKQSVMLTAIYLILASILIGLLVWTWPAAQDFLNL